MGLFCFNSFHEALTEIVEVGCKLKQESERDMPRLNRLQSLIQRFSWEARRHHLSRQKSPLKGTMSRIHYLSLRFLDRETERERERDLEKERERDLDPDLDREERDPDFDLLVLDIFEAPPITPEEMGMEKKKPQQVSERILPAFSSSLPDCLDNHICYYNGA